MLGAGQEEGVDVVERRIRVQVVDHIVHGDRDAEVLEVAAAEELRGGVQERLEDAAVAAHSRVGLGLRRVIEKDREAQRPLLCD